jgi:hypothetical protein
VAKAHTITRQIHTRRQNTGHHGTLDAHERHRSHFASLPKAGQAHTGARGRDFGRNLLQMDLSAASAPFVPRGPSPATEPPAAPASLLHAEAVDFVPFSRFADEVGTTHGDGDSFADDAELYFIPATAGGFEWLLSEKEPVESDAGSSSYAIPYTGQAAGFGGASDAATADDDDDDDGGSELQGRLPPCSPLSPTAALGGDRPVMDLALEALCPGLRITTTEDGTLSFVGDAW